MNYYHKDKDKTASRLSYFMGITIILRRHIYLFEVEWRIYASLIYGTIGSDNGLSPVRRQAVIWTNAGSF